MLSRPIPLDVVLEILNHALPRITSVKDVDGVSRFTRIVDDFCLINNNIASRIGLQSRYFDVCVGDLTIPHRALDVVRTLGKRCKKAKSLTLVLKFGQDIPEDAFVQVFDLLHEVSPIVEKLHLYAPETRHGAFFFFFFF